jgi:hypothetical protein
MTATDRPPRPRGIIVTWAAFALGVAVSVAANVAHTWHPKPEILKAHLRAGGTLDNWAPDPGAQLGAAFFPLALLLCVEILQRVPWPPGVLWTIARFGGTSIVAGVAAVVSYGHMHGLLLTYGENQLTATIGPLAVDGLMVVSSFGLLALSRTRGGGPAEETGPVDQPEVDHAGTGRGVLVDRWSRPVLQEVDQDQVAGPDQPERVAVVVPAASPEQDRPGHAEQGDEWTVLASAADHPVERTTRQQDQVVVDQGQQAAAVDQETGPAPDRTIPPARTMDRTAEPDRPEMDQDQVDQIAAALPGVDRTAVEAAVRIAGRGARVSRRTLRDEGVTGGTGRLNELAGRLREALGQDEAQLQAGMVICPVSVPP